MERDNAMGFTQYTERISTHTLTWSVTRVDIRSYSTLYNFNSHAHVERDKRTSFISNLFSNFNSHAHVERDDIISAIIDGFKDFNSHAHVERDRRC